MFHTVHPAGRGPYIVQEISEAIGAGAAEGRGFSASAIQKFAVGRKTNPTMRTVVRDLAVATVALSPESRDLVLAVVVRLSELEALAATPPRRRGRSR
ncbi:hypothetical protein GCM10010495_80070 [Kitasatospora herbaricolor]|uniref:hypothetical protein n=1 Tax=Kitasatospora herbaricolor TaxID=68217 RepID=UPI00174988A5|nr:hypothetical protein [Kitasatospora herbaricolor]MDQ0305557.1 hypothetical protein [Kitasatospora herbaricolor]GGV50401.1 hypothetical protein GCM10010495_80070 [Kitasatospora herbaricolor]